MGRDRIRYLISKKNSDGTRRYYWQPDELLAAAGWDSLVLGKDEAGAIKAAINRNAEVDDWRAKGCPRRKGARADKASDGSAPRGSVYQLIDIYKAGPAGETPPGQSKPAPQRFGGKPAAAAGSNGGPEFDNEVEPDAELEDGSGYGYDYNGLKPETRRSYDGALNYIAKWIGPLPVKSIDKAIVLERLTTLRQQRHADGPHKGKRKVATALLVGRIGRMLWAASSFLVDKDHPCFVPSSKEHNPWAQLRARDRRRKPKLWSREVREAMVEAACQEGLYSVAAAIKLNWWMGQREGDILRLPANVSVTGDPHEIEQGKTAAAVYLPIGIVPEIVDTVAILRAWQKHAGLAGIRLLIDERNGLTWTEHRFRKAFREIVRARAIKNALSEADGHKPDHALAKALEGATFQLLRHTAITLLIEAGCTPTEAAAISGHTVASINRIIETYGRRTAVTAKNAFEKRLEKEGGQ